ncbi:Clathrin heavy chain 1 [Olea europaea subsp. europaea]|uniref:Clathrin heavy chain 1 n=1 Tax=Olea europaea subsp. europaea TaxID=158383 RepID=A0A8S0S0V3_OLEEU|nr:Clathrin heavy chain 1 [Olea europaea subsp. europaea]
MHYSSAVSFTSTTAATSPVLGRPQTSHTIAPSNQITGSGPVDILPINVPAASDPIPLPKGGKCKIQEPITPFIQKKSKGYVVGKMDGDLWAKVLDPKNEFGRQLIDQVVSSALPKIGEVALEAQLYEEAFAILKFNLDVQVINMLLDNIRDINQSLRSVLKKMQFGVSLLKLNTGKD